MKDNIYFYYGGKIVVSVIVILFLFNTTIEQPGMFGIPVWLDWIFTVAAMIITPIIVFEQKPK